MNDVLELMIASLVKELGFEQPLTVAHFDDFRSVSELAMVADLLVIDLGLDTSHEDPSLYVAGQDDPPVVPIGLAHALDSLERLIDLERARLTRSEHARRIVLVNSSTAFWDTYVLAQLDCSYTTVHSRVRRATVKPIPDAEAKDAAIARTRLLMRWGAREKLGGEALRVHPAETVDFAELDDYRGFGTGWAYPDPEHLGIWTCGRRSELKVALDPVDDRDLVLALSLGPICIAPDESLVVEVLLNGRPIAARGFTADSAESVWRVELPHGSFADGTSEFAFLIEEPRSPLALGWSADNRPLGFFVRAMTLDEADRSVSFGDNVVFFKGSGGERFLGDGWSILEPTGVWTVGERAQLILQPPETLPAGAELVLGVTPFVTIDHPELEVEVSSGNSRLAVAVSRYGEPIEALRIPLPRTVANIEGRTVIDLQLRVPARPVDLRLGEDSRRLGVHLRSLALRPPVSTDAPGGDPATVGRTLRKALGRAVRFGS
jgi:hypothetical protein